MEIFFIFYYGFVFVILKEWKLFLKNVFFKGNDIVEKVMCFIKLLIICVIYLVFLSKMVIFLICESKILMYGFIKENI